MSVQFADPLRLDVPRTFVLDVYEVSDTLVKLPGWRSRKVSGIASKTTHVIWNGTGL
jgi:hypothetical protein